MSEIVRDVAEQLLPNVDWTTPAGVDPVNDGVREQLLQHIAEALASTSVEILLSLGFAQPIALVASDLTWHRPLPVGPQLGWVGLIAPVNPRLDSQT